MAKMFGLCEITLDKPDRICYNINMNRIEQTTLTIADIAEHREFLRDEQDEQIVDDMLVRFAVTFTERIEYDMQKM
jgi:hypothetical protein